MSSTLRLLIVRFSSFGDIVQATAAVRAFALAYPGSEVDWLLRADFASLLDSDPALRKVISFRRIDGVLALIRLAWRLSGSAGGYTHVYDAHCNLRSTIFCAVMRLRAICSGRALAFARRPKDRIRRWLLFTLRIQLLPRPFRGAESFLRPLKKWSIDCTPAPTPSLTAPPGEDAELDRWAPYIVLAPSAAWKMKRWPIAHWRKLIELLPKERFVLLGGPEDAFCEEIRSAAPERVLNLAGSRDLQGSLRATARARLVVANDTGLLHAADRMGRPTIALIGPTAFGYPSGPLAQTLEVELACKPCSKDGSGGCSNSLYKRCLIEITPERAATAAREAMR